MTETPEYYFDTYDESWTLYRVTIGRHRKPQAEYYTAGRAWALSIFPVAEVREFRKATPKEVSERIH